ncbi:Hypothetical_protein [Hexamita inflata]|uniref:Hypothetical_protein n=1 Tax=Hexamita inflata TaxID=28002 RepID=A0AA86US20_9EUKA|nr:Hypothetical protein HINF_LOCUS50086 [Hexamita inflata]
MKPPKILRNFILSNNINTTVQQPTQQLRTTLKNATSWEDSLSFYNLRQFKSLELPTDNFVKLKLKLLELNKKLNLYQQFVDELMKTESAIEDNLNIMFRNSFKLKRYSNKMHQ